MREMKIQTQDLFDQFSAVFEVFDREIPQKVQKIRQERNLKNIGVAFYIPKNWRMNEDDESREDIYYMLAISCKHRDAIGELSI